MMQAYVSLYKYKGPVKDGGPERFEKVKDIVADEMGRMLDAGYWILDAGCWMKGARLKASGIG